MSSAEKPPDPPYRIEFYAADNGSQPAAKFIDGLDRAKKATLLAAIETVLAQQGKDVCETEFGKNLGKGLYEFRLRDKRIVLRLYFHAHGDKLILLLGGYDKGRFSAGLREQRAIAAARKCLKDWKLTA